MTVADAQVISKAIGEVADALFERIKRIEARLANLEQRPPAPRWCGIWRPDSGYTAGDLVTCSGGLWLAARSTSARPGTDDSGWSLVVKSGSYGPLEDRR